VICDDAGKGSLSGSRRAVKNNGSELVSRNGTAQKPPLTNNMILPDVFIQISRSHSGGERLLFIF
jgi:hypothetical protein